MSQGLERTEQDEKEGKKESPIPVLILMTLILSGEILQAEINIIYERRAYVPEGKVTQDCLMGWIGKPSDLQNMVFNVGQKP